MLEMTPLDVDRHSFRDLKVMFGAAEKREKEKWRHTLYQMQDLRDVVAGALGEKPKGYDYLFKKVFGVDKRRAMRKYGSHENFSRYMKEAHAKVLAKHKKRRRRGNGSRT